MWLLSLKLEHIEMILREWERRQKMGEIKNAMKEKVICSRISFTGKIQWTYRTKINLLKQKLSII